MKEVEKEHLWEKYFFGEYVHTSFPWQNSFAFLKQFQFARHCSGCEGEQWGNKAQIPALEAYILVRETDNPI